MKKKNEKHPARALIKQMIIGIVLIMLPFIYFRPKYEQLETKEICVESIGYTRGSGKHSSRSYYLNTTDGDRYEIRGDFDYSYLNERLSSGDLVTIKYYHGLYYFWATDFIKEMTYDGEELVSYSGDKQSEIQIVMTVAGSIVIIIGLLVYNSETKLISNIIKKKKRPKGKKTRE